MDGIHDMGGVEGYGPVPYVPEEPIAIGARWEAFAGAAFFALERSGRTNIDAHRHRIERLDPDRYLPISYWGRWLAAVEAAAVEQGIATADEVEAAVARIGAGQIFAALPEGLDTEVQERGSRLSAGERQIVSLARAALVDPAVLILDEATSSIDPGTESLVEAAMDSLMRARTVIVIAHRLSTAARCDRVGVVLDGRLAELAPHDELVASGGHYTELFEAWSRT